MQESIIINRPASYDLEPYIGHRAAYTLIDDPATAYTGTIERARDCGEACIHDDGDDWTYTFTGIMNQIKIFM